MGRGGKYLQRVHSVHYHGVWLAPQLLDPLIATLKPQSNRPSYSKKWTLSQLVHRPEPPGQGKSSVTHKSAITDHAVEENHVIDWDKAKVVDREAQ